VVLASRQNHPSAIAVDATSVYWVNRGDSFDASSSNGAVMKISIAGAPSPTPLALSQVAPLSIAIDATSVYWTVYAKAANAAENTGEIRKTPLGGGAITSLATGQASIGPLTTDPTYVYWWTYTGPGPLGGIKRVLKTGGQLLDVAGGFPSPWKIAVDSVNLYWTVGYAGQRYVVMHPISGGQSIDIIADMQPSGLSLACSSIYWTEVATNDGSVRKGPIGGTTGDYLAMHQAGPHALAVDATGVYWTNTDSGAIMKTDLSGSGIPITLAAGQNTPFDITLDAGSIYWVNNAGDGSVVKLAK